MNTETNDCPDRGNLEHETIVTREEIDAGYTKSALELGILFDPDWVMWLKKLGQGKGYGKSSDSLNYKRHDGFIEQTGPGWIEFVETA